MRLAQLKLFLMLPNRIVSRLSIDNECWVWVGEVNRNGYGRINYEGKRYMVHRLIWKLVGRPLEDGKVLDHLCRNRRCCNPTHLSQVSHRNNVHRGKAKLFRSMRND